MTQATSGHYSGRAEYFRALDGMRGILALVVASFHSFWFSHIANTTFVLNATVWLEFFFVFSGFLLYRLYQNRLSNSDQAKRYLKKRFARIYPIHFFMIGATLLFAIFRIITHKLGMGVHETGEIMPFQPGSPENWLTLFTNLTMTHSMGFYDSLSFNHPSWSIGAEFFAYIVFMFTCLFVPIKKWWHIGLTMVGIFVIYYGLYLNKPDMDITYDWGFMRCLAGFYTGIVTCWVYMKIKPFIDSLPDRLFFYGATMLEIITVMGYVYLVIYMPGKLQFFVAPFAFSIVLVLAFDGGLVSRFLSLPLFMFLGRISYSVYMIHGLISMMFYMVGSRLFPVLRDLDGGILGDLYLGVYLLLVIGCSHITWTYIEMRGQKWILEKDFSEIFAKPFRAVFQ